MENAEVAELEDARDSKSRGAQNPVWVRLPPSALLFKFYLIEEMDAKNKLTHAKWLLRNAREELKKVGVDRVSGVYKDLKYVSSASGMAYLAGLEALKAIFIKFKLVDEKTAIERLKNVTSYFEMLKKLNIGKDRDVLMNLFDSAYGILHIGGYYRELRSKKAIDDGFEKVEKIIEIVEKHIGNSKP